MSSDSIDDDNLKTFQDAVAPELISCMSSNTLPTNANSRSSRNKICNSNGTNSAEHHNHLKTTPEFRDHLSKKLSLYLDSIIEVDQSRTKKVEHSETTNGGVKLFQNSEYFLDEDEKVEISTPKLIRKSKPASTSESEDDDLKFSAVVVSGTDVLMGGEGAFALKNNTDSSNHTKRHSQSGSSRKVKSKKRKKE